MDKYCSGCQSVKLFSDFAKNRRQKDGYANWCKACLKRLWQRPENLLKRKQRRLKDYGYTLFIETKSRAKARGLAFDLEPSDLLIPEFCPVTGEKLVVELGGRTNNTPTVDRKDQSKGYIKGNVFVISWIANKVKSDQVDPALFEGIARYMRD
jgi:hypothetical protein